MDAVVVGGGVSGMTTAVVLAEAGWSVRIVARDHWTASTSAVAGGMWYPYLAEPAARVGPWSMTTYARFSALVATPAAGVDRALCREYFRAPGALPRWTSGFEGLRWLTRAELPPDMSWGIAFPTFVATVPVYLGWMERRLADLGVDVELGRSLGDLAEVVRPADALVVNCTGLGAGELADDDSLRPVRGQVLRHRRSPDSRCFVDQAAGSGLAYAVARRDDVIIGGTSEPDRRDVEPDAETTRAILARAVAVDPTLADTERLEVRVGLRPVRPTVRVEADGDVAGVPLVHNYGHGGAGFTLSWGCADEVLGLAEAALGGR